MAKSQVTKTLQAALHELKQERAQIDRAIGELETVMGSLGGVVRSAGSATGKGAAKKIVKKNWSPAARKAAAERMRKFWADRRKKAAASK